MSGKLASCAQDGWRMQEMATNNRSLSSKVRGAVLRAGAIIASVLLDLPLILITPAHHYFSEMAAGLKTVILLSFVLAVGFLLVILSCALWANWLPLLVALTFVLAPLPNALFRSCASDDFSAADYGEGSGPVDLGHFITSAIVITGFALPLVLAHSGIIHPMACIMSIVGGGLVYATILAYSAVFKQDTDEF